MKIMKPSDLHRLKGSSNGNTHLARYDFANNAPVRARVNEVLDVECPDCGSESGKACIPLSSRKVD